MGWPIAPDDLDEPGPDVASGLTYGRGLAWPLRVDPATGGLATVSGEANVLTCIRALLSTRVGERVMSEDVGIVLPDLLFENRQGVMDILPLRIIDCLNRFEPRIYRVQAKAVPFEPNGINCHVGWVLRSTGSPSNLTYPYYLRQQGAF